jgi:periplasmic divalent cation tolerance protein
MKMGNQAPAPAVQIMTTMEKRKDAEKVAAFLVENKLAACVQIAGPVLSLYRWKGNTESAEEWQCFIKTRADLYNAVEAAIKSHHPYEIPEIIALPILQGSPDYLSWLHEATCDPVSV